MITKKKEKEKKIYKERKMKDVLSRKRSRNVFPYESRTYVRLRVTNRYGGSKKLEEWGYDGNIGGGIAVLSLITSVVLKR